ncbi:acyl-CoA oxidase [Delitschia confertaspora ATCC 74209]|uniref:Acyl-coenzyme A oxidase n=1 Tax=Delitschia confertaspora ATCC 74209 TaxID=1513339 RepID=A0A9P4MP74_9PLEO|nr:acyl-CoA oxidase [Delitschia confertaspora ATCC 74209]
MNTTPTSDTIPQNQNKQTTLLKKARDGVSFNIFDMSCVIYGGAHVVRKRRAAFERVETITGTRDTSKLPRSYGNMNREEAYEEGLEWGKAAFEDGINYKHDYFDSITPRYALANANPFGLTMSMFVPTIAFQGTAEQKAKWIPLCESGKINGAYCQTELGHGTFVRGIETTATWDSETDEFVIHSPTLSSTKFWPGAIGFSCTHAVVVARLIVCSKDYGAHLFMVQFRSLEDGTPMPGIELGDVGLKMSYNGTCNGFATFNNVRIPRTDMLMGNSSVSRDGSYQQSPHAKLSYATLVIARTTIIRAVGFQLAQAVTITTRYSTVREQGLGPNGLSSSEMSLMTYKSQHFRILTLIAKAYAILFASWVCDAEYKEFRGKQDKGDHSTLGYTHNMIAGLKAWCTQTAADGAEDARKCCGGQGYLTISGLPEIVAAVTATATFEGENYVLEQQLGRYLFKCIDNLKASKPIDHRLSYLVDGYAFTENGLVMDKDSSCGAQGTEFLQPEVQLSVYRHRALRLILAAYIAVRLSPKGPMKAWNENMMSIVAAARAHTEYVVLLSFMSQVGNAPPSTSSAIKTALTRICSLFALSTIINPQSNNAISFIEDGYLSLAQLNTIRSLVNDLLTELLPDAVGLTDAWDFTDASLCSALGMMDGNVYETIMHWIRQMPINTNAWNKHKGVFQPGWKQWVEPVLRAKL